MHQIPHASPKLSFVTMKLYRFALILMKSDRLLHRITVDSFVQTSSVLHFIKQLLENETDGICYL